MATHAHCAYCFESLAASFEQRQPLSLARVEDLWQQYQTAENAEGDQDDKAVASKPQYAEEASDDEDDEDDADMTEAETDEPVHPKPAAVSRLLGSKSRSATSSSSSLPSTQSSNASSKAVSSTGANTPASSLSSRSSLFSFGHKKQLQCEEATGSARKYGAHPLFVTWNIKSRSSGQKILRGCIGTFRPEELGNGLREYALTSAFEDERFQPIPVSQLPSLSCEVTLLTDFSNPTHDPLDWEVGKHGIRIWFTRHGYRYNATYLPSVASEHGWTKEETIVSLMRKAGWNSNGGSGWAKTWKDGKGELVRYEGRKVELDYSDWKAWRDWVASTGVKTKLLN